MKECEIVDLCGEEELSLEIMYKDSNVIKWISPETVICTFQPVWTIFDPILSGYRPLILGSMVKVNNQLARAMEVGPNFQVLVRYEENLGSDDQWLSLSDIENEWRCDWRELYNSTNMVIGNLQHKISQMDGDAIVDDDSNVGNTILSLCPKFEENECQIRELVEEVKENGIDTDNLSPHLRRFDTNGFAMQASK